MGRYIINLPLLFFWARGINAKSTSTGLFDPFGRKEPN